MNPPMTAEADVVADPPNWQRAAGLITYYNRHKFHAALITREGGERVVHAGLLPGRLAGRGADVPRPVPGGRRARSRLGSRWTGRRSGSSVQRRAGRAGAGCLDHLGRRRAGRACLASPGPSSASWRMT